MTAKTRNAAPEKKTAVGVVKKCLAGRERAEASGYGCFTIFADTNSGNRGGSPPKIGSSPCTGLTRRQEEEHGRLDRPRRVSHNDREFPQTRPRTWALGMNEHY